jgi:hypothetical protein
LCSALARGAFNRDFAWQMPYEIKPSRDRPMVNIAPQLQISAPRAPQSLAAPRLRASAVHFMRQKQLGISARRDRYIRTLIQLTHYPFSENGKNGEKRSINGW